MNKKIIGFTLLMFIALPLGACSNNSLNHVHTWSKYYDNGDGTHTRRCLTDISHTETGPHKFVLDTIITDATDVAPGKERYRCDLCGATDVRVIPPTGNYVFDRKVVDSKYLYERCSEHSAIYYMSSKEGAYGNPDYLFEDSEIGDDYTEVESIKSDGTQYIDTGIDNHAGYSTSINNMNSANRLPSNYQAVEYIEANGKQYIDLDITPTGLYTVEGVVESTATTTGALYCARGKAADDNSFTLFFNLNNKDNNCRYDYGSSQKTLSCFKMGEKTSFKSSKGSLYVNDSLVYSVTSSNFTAGNRLKLFASFYNGLSSNISNYFKGRLYSLSIQDENMQDVYSFIPCYDKNSYITGLYDSIGGKFYTSKTGTNFLKGNDIEFNNDKRLPDAYQEVEYIQSTGEQWIDTGCKFTTDNVAVDFKVSIDINDVHDLTFFGSHDANYNYDCAIYHANDYGTGVFRHWIGSSKNLLPLIYADGVNDVKLSIKNGLYTCSLNGVTSAAEYTGSCVTGENIYLFGLHRFDTIIERAHGYKLYSFKITDNDILVRDYVPCYRKSDNTIGLYDLVTKEFFINNGEGVFLKGNDVDNVQSLLPDSYQQLDYIESTGTQYIDTGVYWENGTSLTYECTVQFTSTATTKGSGHHRCTISCNEGKLRVALVNSDISATEKHVAKVVWPKGNYDATLKYTSYIDDESIGTYSIQHNDDSRPYFLFACTGWSTESGRPPYSFEKMRIYGCRFLRNDNVIRNFIPCYRLSDNAAGLYDTVSNTFFANQGTGEFVKGNKIYAQSNSYLPKEYQQIEYIEGTGNEWIDLGFAINPETDDVECTFQSTVVNQNGMILGTDIYTSSYFWLYHYHDGNRFNIYTKDGTTQRGLYGPTNDLNKHTAEYKNKKYVFDGAECGSYDVTLYPGTANSFMFGTGDEAHPYRYIGKVYSCKIWQNGVLAKEYVPCYRKSDGMAGMFDVISETFLANSGSGEFIKGPASSGTHYEDFTGIESQELPDGYHQLAYIRSYGSQTINTGVIGKAKVEIDGIFSRVNKDQKMGYSSEEIEYFGVAKNNRYFDVAYAAGNRDTITYDFGETNSEEVSFAINGSNVYTKTMGTVEDKELQLFSLGGKTGCYLKFYGAKIYQGGQLVRNFIPAKMIYTNEIGVYDLVEQKFYVTSTGTSFEQGSDMDLPVDTDNINIFVSRFSNEKILQTTTIKNYKIYDYDNNVVRDFVPVIRNSDGKGGFYDVVEQKFYESQIGNDFVYGKKIGHHFDSGKVTQDATYCIDGVLEYTCSVCGRKVHEKVDHTAYKVEFKIPDYIQGIKIFSEVDPRQYEMSLIGYTRNLNTYNFSKVNTYIMFEVLTDREDITIKTSSGEVEHVRDNIYRIKKIVHDTVVVIS